MVYQNLAHHTRGNGEEVDPVLPGKLGAEDFQISFMNEAGGIEAVVKFVSAHTAGGERAEFRIDEGEQIMIRVGLSGAPGVEEHGHVLRVVRGIIHAAKESPCWYFTMRVGVGSVLRFRRREWWVALSRASGSVQRASRRTSAHLHRRRS
jgi:hypothetical protein